MSNLRLGIEQIYPIAVYDTENKEVENLALLQKFLVKINNDFKAVMKRGNAFVEAYVRFS